jgi:4-hydroxybenzoyl-CoA thioesterase
MAVFRTERTLRFGDCDPAGIAYFPCYFDLLNGVSEEWWGSLGLPWRVLISDRKIGLPTVHLDADFRAVSVFSDQLTFALRIEKIGSRSLDLSHEISRGETSLWSARQTVVATSLDTHKSIPWPADILARLQQFQEK